MTDVQKRNKELIEQMPYLQPRNVWTGKIPEDYDYSYIRGESELPKGWNKLFLQLCNDIRQPLIDANYLDKFRFSQIKEKYGTLRAYNFGAPTIVHDIIGKYEYISQFVCQVCGKPATSETSGWISSYCDDCIGKLKDMSEPIVFNPIMRITRWGNGTSVTEEIDVSDEWNRLYENNK